MDEEKREPADRDLIVRLSERFEIFTEQVLKKLDAVLEMRESVDQLLHRKNTKRSQDAQRKRKERVDAARQRNENRVALGSSMFDVNMSTMHCTYIKWAHVGIQYGIMGSYPDWLAWLASDWNHWTFTCKPITRVSNRPHYHSKGMRNEATWTDLFGRETGISDKTFFEPIFWEFMHIMVKVFAMMEEMPDWCNVKDSFKAHLQVACSGLSDMTKSGMLQLKNYPPFDHMEEKCAQVPEYRAMATRVMQSFRRGVCQKKIADPDLAPELVRMGLMRSSEHIVQLRKECARLAFLYKLRNGDLTAEERQQCDNMEVWGFDPTAVSL